ncbi:MAG TPA: hypothetical protein VN108_00055 [Marmoricola sp.]|nr:hypothetical protein [Marmoricola sp.]
MRLALVEALFGLRGGLALARRVHGGDEDEEVGPDRRIDVAQLQTLVRRHFDLLDEIMVHVLDYQYIYNGRDEDYVNSIWISWSLVPGVVDRVEEYVLRTLCALSVTSAQHLIGPEIFEDVVERLETNLKLMEGRSRSHHAVSLAIRLLEDERGVARLRALFPVARYVVELTESFVFDGRLNAALVVDDLTTIEDNRTTYNIATGDYRGEVITSPIGFLLDRFPRYPDQAGAGNVEYESIWQMLQLI